MSNKKYMQLTVASLTLALLLLGMSFSNISPVSAPPVSAQVSVPRDLTLYTTGYDVPPTSFNPCILDWGQGMDTYLMYEPLFGTNAATGALIPWLGQSIEWLNSTAIEVTLRNGIYWVKMLPNGTVVYYRPITSEDVKFSYYLLGGFTNSPGGEYWMMNDFAQRVGNESNFQIVNSSVFIVHILPEYNNSQVVWRRMTQGFLIMPADVWEQINADYPNGTLVGFANDWQAMKSNATEANWMVASGMYLPYWHDDTTTILKRNDLWWGITVLGERPWPTYVCDTTYESNIQKADAMEAGDTDWSGDYMPGITAMNATFPYLGTYLPYPPYFADSTVKVIVPNFDEYPLNEPWLHQVIAYLLNFTDINAVNSNYLEPASPLLIAKDDFVARELVNTTIEANYTITTNVTKALEILNQYCINVGGTWYTDVGPSADYLATYNETIDQYKSESLHGDGVNIPLGPWNLIDVSGWTDTNAIDEVIAYESSAVGITINPTFYDYDTYVTMMNDMSFDLSMYCMGAGLNNNFYQRYYQFFCGVVGAYGHVGDYRNPTLENLISSLDTVPNGTQAEYNIANQIEEIVGSQMPLIPVAGAPDWYIYSDKYFGCWPTSVNDPILPTSPYGGSSQTTDLQTIILKLRPRGAEVGDLGSFVNGVPTFFAFDGVCNYEDIPLFIECYRGTAPADAMYLGDLGSFVNGVPTFYKYTGSCNYQDIPLFILCYRGKGPS